MWLRGADLAATNELHWDNRHGYWRAGVLQRWDSVLAGAERLDASASASDRVLHANLGPNVRDIYLHVEPASYVVRIGRHDHGRRHLYGSFDGAGRDDHGHQCQRLGRNPDHRYGGASAKCVANRHSGGARYQDDYLHF